MITFTLETQITGSKGFNHGV